MIIIGYPCIGKSSLAEINKKFIDLESSYFKMQYNNEFNWVHHYINTALYLNKQGYDVFISSHKDVYQYLIRETNIVQFYELELNKSAPIVFCYPENTDEMYEYFREAAFKRWNHSKTTKDLRAYERIKDHYHNDINDIEEFTKKYGLYDYNTLILDNSDYILAEELQQFRQYHFPNKDKSNGYEMNLSLDSISCLELIKYLYNNNYFRLCSTSIEFDDSKYDGIILDKYLYLRKNQLKTILEEKFGIYDFNMTYFVDDMKSENALKINKNDQGKSTVQLSNTNGKRFYAIPLNKLNYK